jgi:hypothetical protein
MIRVIRGMGLRQLGVRAGPRNQMGGYVLHRLEDEELGRERRRRQRIEKESVNLDTMLA